MQTRRGGDWELKSPITPLDLDKEKYGIAIQIDNTLGRGFTTQVREGIQAWKKALQEILIKKVFEDKEIEASYARARTAASRYSIACDGGMALPHQDVLLLKPSLAVARPIGRCGRGSRR